MHGHTAQTYDGPDDIAPFDRSVEITDTNCRWQEQDLRRTNEETIP